MARVLAVAVVVAVVLAGVWVAGGVLTDDMALAQVLVGVWFGLTGLVAAAVALRRRPLAVPVLGAWLLTSAAAGGWLLWTSTVDRVVDEDVAVATAPVAAGAFADGAHETSGTATLLDRPDGTRLLTLTSFATDPGPDLRVLLAPGPDGDVSGAVDVGALKGNEGDQQYAVPADAPRGSVVIWCRAFSVRFGHAPLAPG